MPLDPQIAHRFTADGFVNAGRLLDDAMIGELRDDLDGRIHAAFEEGSSREGGVGYAVNLATVEGDRVYQMVNLWESSAVVRRLIAHPGIVEAAAELARTRDLQVWFDQAQCKPPRNGGATEWHQDAMYWHELAPHIALTAWVALDEADVTNGCMWMVPGSHQWGVRGGELMALQSRRDLETFSELPPLELPPGSPPWSPPIPCPVRAGEVHFHHCLTWHGSPRNKSPRPRRAIAIHYLPRGVRYTGYQRAHPLAEKIRVAKDMLMLEDPERFPVVLRDGLRV